MKITAIDPLALGYRKVDPPMARSFAVVRVETDAGHRRVGRGEHQLGPQLPDGVRRPPCATSAPAPLLGTDPTDVRGRLAQLHVLLDGYLGWEGLTSQVIAALEIACWDITGQALGQPLHRLLGRGQPAAAAVRHRHDDVRGDGRLPRPLLRRGAGARLRRLQGAPRPIGRRRRGDRGRRARARRPRRHDRRRLVLVPRRPHRARRWPSACRPWGTWGSSRSPSRRCASTTWRGWRPQPDPGGRGRAGLLGGAVRPPRPASAPPRSSSPTPPSAAGSCRAWRSPPWPPSGASPSTRTSAGRPSSAWPPTSTGRWRPTSPWMEYDIDPWQPLVSEVGGPPIAPGRHRGRPPGGARRARASACALPDDVAERFPYVPGDTYAEVFPEHEKGRAAR